MKVLLERLSIADDASWAMLNRRLPDGIPFQWHHHPEFELTLTQNSRGQRFIGDHAGRYDHGDLVLIGPNVPHTWSSIEPIEHGLPHVALVMWFQREWAERLTGGFRELHTVGQMLERASGGLQFSRAAAQRVAPMIEDLFQRSPVERFLLLIQVLAILAQDADAVGLSTIYPDPETGGAERTRMDRVLNHIHQHHAQGVTMAELADVAALSQSGLHRTFLRHTRQTVSQYMARLRIGQACSLLSAGQLSIATIAGEVGYDSLANFNRQFKALKSMTPRQYRQSFSGR